MMYYKHNEWHIAETSVRYKDGDQETTKSVGAEGKGWWIELEKLHEDIKVIEFSELKASEVQKKRLEEVNELNIGDGYSSEINGYVMYGVFPDRASHILKDLENRKTKLDGILNSMETMNMLQSVIMESKMENATMQMELMTMIAGLQGGDL